MAKREPTRWTHHGDGTKSKIRKRDGKRVYYLQVFWRGGRYTEHLGVTVRERRKRIGEIEKAKENGTYLPPKLRRRTEQIAAIEQARQSQDRERLLYETATAEFLREVGDEYANPREAENMLRRLGKFFNGRKLDELRRVDVRQYYVERLTATGAFKGWRKVGRRSPETEIALLAAVYRYFADDVGLDLVSPCHRPRVKRKDGLLAPYKRKHEPVIPSKDAVTAILAAAPTRESRALFALCYYTGGRPMSEPCQLTHGDVTFGRGGTWGSVTYRDTKTGGERRLLLHPEAEPYLRDVMDPVPLDPAERETWGARPIFRRRDSAGKLTLETWDQKTYQRQWKQTIKAVVGKFPDLADAWVRDFRSAFKTTLTDAGVQRDVIEAMLGHRGGVAEGYYRLRDEPMRAALVHLALNGDAGLDAVHDDHRVSTGT